MSGKTEDLKLSDRQRTRLLSLGLESATPGNKRDPDEERGDLLCDILRCPLPPAEPRPGSAKSTLQAFRSVLGPSLGQLLTDPQTDITVLKQIKEYAKTLGKGAASEIERNVFLAVYFAAIAGALAFHSESITEHTRSDLSKFFTQFAAVPWMRSDLRDLFVQAAECC